MCVTGWFLGNGVMGSMASIVCSDLPLTYPRQSCDSCSSLYTGLCCHVHVQSICGLSSTFSFHFLLLSLSLSLSLFLVPLLFLLSFSSPFLSLLSLNPSLSSFLPILQSEHGRSWSWHAPESQTRSTMPALFLQPQASSFTTPPLSIATPSSPA